MRRHRRLTTVVAVLIATVVSILYFRPDFSENGQDAGRVSSYPLPVDDGEVDGSGGQSGESVAASQPTSSAGTVSHAPDVPNLRQRLPGAMIVQQKDSPKSDGQSHRSVLVRMPDNQGKLVRVDEVVEKDPRGRETLLSQTVYSASHVIIRTNRPPGNAVEIAAGVYRLPLKARDLSEWDRELAAVKAESAYTLVEKDFMIFGAAEAVDAWSSQPVVIEAFAANPPASSFRHSLAPVIVAVLDSGVNLQHPALTSAILRNEGEIAGNGVDDDGNGFVDDVLGWDVHQNDPVPQDEEGHGTLIAGLIGGILHPSLPAGGLAPNARLVPVRVLDKYGAGYVSHAIIGLEYAAARNAQVVNVSWGTSSYSELLQEAISNYPGTVVAAAGNSGANLDRNPLYPAAFNLPNVVAVAASDRAGNLSSYSSYGAYRVHLAAPGDAIPGPGLTQEPQVRSGTSMAAPHVVAALAMGYALAPESTPAELRSLLVLSAQRRDAMEGRVLAGGVLDIASFLQMVSPDHIEQLDDAGVVYNITFESPPHSPGQLSSLGAPLSPSAIIAGVPSVAQGSLFPTQTLVFADSSQETIELGLQGASPSYRYEMEVASAFSPGAGQQALFSIQLRGQAQRSIRIDGQGRVTLTMDSGSPVELGTLQPNTVHRLSFEITFSQDSLKIYIDGALRHDGPLGYIGSLNAIRLSYTGNASTPAVEVDNILLVRDFESLPSDPTRVVADPAALELGPIEVGQVHERTLTLRNVSRYAVEVEEVRATIPEVEVEWSGLLDAYSAVTIPVQIYSDELGSFSGFMEVTSDDPVNPVLPIRVVGAVESPPIISVSPASLSATFGPAGMETLPLTIENEGNVPLVWQLEALSTSGNEEQALEQGSYDFRISTTDERLPFNWSDLRSPESTPLTVTQTQAVVVNLPFDFPFYGVNRSTLRVSPHGYLTFGSTGTTIQNNARIPSSSAPNSLIAPFWDRLDLNGGSIHTRYDQNLGRFGIQFTNVSPVIDGGSVTFQVFLYDTGRIVFNYLTVDVASPGYTVGIENDAGTSGIEIAYNNDVLSDRMSVEFYPNGEWLSAGVAQGTTAPGGSSVVDVNLSGSTLSSGSYSGRIRITSNDRVQPELIIPVELTIGGQASLELASEVLTLEDRIPGTSISETFTIYNPGDSAILITSITSSNDAFTVDFPEGLMLGARHAQDIEVTFAPEELGIYEGELFIVAEDVPGASIIVPIIGRGVTPPTLNFEDIQSNALSLSLESGDYATFTLTLNNTGGFPADWTAARTGELGHVVTVRSETGRDYRAVDAAGEDRWFIIGNQLVRQNNEGVDVQTIAAGLSNETTDVVYRVGRLYVSEFTSGVIRVFDAVSGEELSPVSLNISGIRALEITHDRVFALEETTARLKIFERYTGDILSTSSGTFSTHDGLVFDGFRLRSYNRSTRAFDSLTDSAPAIPVVSLNVLNQITGLALAGDRYVLIDRHRAVIDVSSGRTDEVYWTEVEPVSGRLLPGSTRDIYFSLSAVDLFAGIYETELRLTGPYISDLVLPVTLEVTGTPDFYIEENSLDLAHVVTGTTREGTITVANRGTAPLVINAIDLPPGFSLGSGVDFPITIAPETSWTLVLEYLGGEIGSGDVEIGFTGNVEMPAVSLPVSVQAVPAVALSPENMSFSGSRNEELAASVELTNTGAGPLRVSVVSASLDGAGGNRPVVITPVEYVIAAGQTESLEGALATLGLPSGQYNGSITLETNVPAQSLLMIPVVVTLSEPEVSVGYDTLNIPVFSGVPVSRWELPVTVTPVFGHDWVVSSSEEGVQASRVGDNLRIVATEANLSGFIIFDNGNETYRLAFSTHAKNLAISQLIRTENAEEVLGLHRSTDAAAQGALVLFSSETGLASEAVLVPPSVTDVAYDHTYGNLFVVSLGEKSITRYDGETLSYISRRTPAISAGYSSTGDHFDLAVFTSEKMAFVDNSLPPRLFHYNYDTDSILATETRGTGDAAFSSDGSTIYTWSQGNWAGGTYFSTGYKFPFGSTTATASTPSGQLSRNPFYSPVFVVGNGDVLMKNRRFSGVDMTTIHQFSDNIVAATSNGMFAATRTYLLNANSGQNILPIGNTTEVRVFTASADALLSYLPGTSSLSRYPLNPPTLRLEGEELLVGDIYLERVTQAAFKVYNDGVLPLVIDDVLSSHSAVTLASTLPVSIPAQSSVDLVFDIAPEAVGALASTITLFSNDENAPEVSFDLAATVIRGPEPTLDTPEVEAVLDPGDNTSRTIQLSNSGSAVLTWSVSGVLPSWLSVSPSSGSVLPGQELELEINFHADTLMPGEYQYNLVLTTNSPLHPTVTIPVHLEISEGPGVFVPNHSGIVFDNVYVGSSSARYITIFNVGTEALVLTSVSATGAAFEQTQLENFTILPGESEDVLVTFAPTEVGLAEGELIIASNTGGGSELVIPLSGTGIAAPVLNLSTTAISAETPVFETVTRTLTISNSGGSTLMVSLYTDEGQPFYSFDKSSLSLAPGSSEVITVTLGENNILGGSYSGYIFIETNDPLRLDAVVSISLVVDGDPQLVPLDTDYSYPDTIVQTSRTQNIVLENIGTGPLLVSSIQTSNAAFTLEDQVTSLTVPPQESRTLRVRFAPVEVQEYAGTLTFVTDDPAFPEVEIDLAGRGVKSPAITVSPISISTSINAGDSTVESFTISNDSDSEVALNYFLSVGREEAGTNLDLFSIPSAVEYNPYRKVDSTVGEGIVPFSSGNLTLARGSVFLLNPHLNGITEVNPLTGDYLGTLAVPEAISGGPDGLAFDGIYFYITNGFGTNQIHQMEARSGSIIRSVSIPNLQFDGLAHDGTSLYALDYSRSSIVEIDMDSGTVARTLYSTSGLGGGLTAGGTRQSIFVSRFGSAIYEISTVDGRVIQSFTPPLSVYGLAYSQTHRRLYISDIKTDQLITLDPDSLVIDRTETAEDIGGLAADEYATGNEWFEMSPTDGVLQPGESVTVELSIHAMTLLAGDYASVIHVKSNDINNPVVDVSVDLEVIGAPGILLSPEEIDLGSALLGARLEKTVGVTNKGSDTLIISNIESMMPGLTVTSPLPLYIPARTTQNLPILYIPEETGQHSGEILFTSNDPSDPVMSLPVSASIGSAPTVVLDEKRLEFVLPPGGSTSKMIRIGNTGEAALTWSIDLSSRPGGGGPTTSGQSVPPPVAPDLSAQSAPDTIIVRYFEETTTEALSALEAEIFAQVLYRSHLVDGLTVLEVDTAYASLHQTLDKLQNDPRVMYAEPDYILTASMESIADADFDALWALRNTGQLDGTPGADIDAEAAWEVSNGGQGILVAVIDSGVDYLHEDLVDNIYLNTAEAGNGVDDDGNGYIDDMRGWNFVNNSNSPYDDNGHGTHVAGIVAAMRNDIGTIGVAYRATILPIKFLSASGTGATSDAIRSIEYATLMGADIANCSWGGGAYSQGLYDAIAAAGDAGVIIVAAAGNSSRNIDLSPNYPASYDLANVIAVASTDPRDELSSFSNYGVNTVHIAAPGSSIYSTIPGDRYGIKSGTSMAAPHVAGVAALLLGNNPEISVEEIIDLLQQGADVLPSLTGRVAGGYRLNARGALDALAPPWLSLETNSGSLASGAMTDTLLGVNTQMLSPGRYSASLLVNTNDPKNPTEEIGVILYLRDAEDLTARYMLWVDEYFPGEEDSSVWAPTGDADGDGISNLAEYFFGTNPTTPSTPPAISTRQAGEHIELTFRMNADAGDIAYVIEGSTDLESWSSQSPLEVSELPDGQRHRLVTVTLPLDLEESHKFYRIRVPLPE